MLVGHPGPSLTASQEGRNTSLGKRRPRVRVLLTEPSWLGPLPRRHQGGRLTLSRTPAKQKLPSSEHLLPDASPCQPRSQQIPKAASSSHGSQQENTPEQAGRPLRPAARCPKAARPEPFPGGLSLPVRFPNSLHMYLSSPSILPELGLDCISGHVGEYIFLMEHEMAVHSSILACKSHGPEEPGGLYSLWSRKESDMTEHASCTHTFLKDPKSLKTWASLWTVWPKVGQDLINLDFQNTEIS